MDKPYNSAIGRYNASGFEKRTRHQFWMVFVEGKETMPRLRHPSPQSAILEATRLARLNPYLDVFILEATGFIRQSDPLPPISYHHTSGKSGGQPLDFTRYSTGIKSDGKE